MPVDFMFLLQLFIFVVLCFNLFTLVICPESFEKGEISIYKKRNVLQGSVKTQLKAGLHVPFAK